MHVKRRFMIGQPCHTRKHQITAEYLWKQQQSHHSDAKMKNKTQTHTQRHTQSKNVISFQ